MNRFNIDNIHFIVGMPRCGITYLSRCINFHSQMAVYGQSRFWGRYYLDPESANGYNKKEQRAILEKQKDFTWSATIGDEKGCIQDLSLEQFKQALIQTFETFPNYISPGEMFHNISKLVADLYKKEIVFEKTPHHVNWIERISNNFPNSKFVVIISDPYLFLQFQKNQPDIDFDPIGHSLLWKSLMNSIEKVKSKYSNRIVIVKTENLIANLENELEKITNFFDVSPIHTRSENLPSKHIDPTLFNRELTENDIYWMNALCKKQIINNGYKLKGGGTSLKNKLVSLVLFIKWTLGIMVEFQSNHLGTLSKYIGKWVQLLLKKQ